MKLVGDFSFVILSNRQCCISRMSALLVLIRLCGLRLIAISDSFRIFHLTHTLRHQIVYTSIDLECSWQSTIDTPNSSMISPFVQVEILDISDTCGSHTNYRMYLNIVFFFFLFLFVIVFIHIVYSSIGNNGILSFSIGTLFAVHFTHDWWSDWWILYLRQRHGVGSWCTSARLRRSNSQRPLNSISKTQVDTTDYGFTAARVLVACVKFIRKLINKFMKKERNYIHI